jgi:hypothetical protein
MHVAKIISTQKGKVYSSTLLRRTYREGGKVKHQTLAYLSALPDAAVEVLRQVLRGEAVGALDTRFSIERSLPHGNVLAVLGALRSLGLEKMLGSACRERDLAVRMIVARVLTPASKLATSRLWNRSTLALVLEVSDASEDELYVAMDWLGQRQDKIENKLAAKHLKDGEMVFTTSPRHV